MGANSVPSRFFLAILFSYPDVGYQFSKDVGACSMQHGVLYPKCPDASIIIVKTVSDDDVGGSHLLPCHSGTVHGFSRVN